MLEVKNNLKSSRREPGLDGPDGRRRLCPFRAEDLHPGPPVRPGRQPPRRRPEAVRHARRGAALRGERWASFFSSLLTRSPRLAAISPSDFPPPAGFTAQQAEAMVKILVRMTQSNMEVIYGDMVTKAQQVRPAPGGGSSPSRRNICRRVFVASGDHVPARDVPDHCCEEGHGHPGEERVLRSAGRERGGRLPHQPPLSSSEVLNWPICLQKLKIQILKLKDHLVVGVFLEVRAGLLWFLRALCCRTR